MSSLANVAVNETSAHRHTPGESSLLENHVALELDSLQLTEIRKHFNAIRLLDRKNSFEGSAPEEPFTRAKEVNQFIRCHEAAPIDKRQRANMCKAVCILENVAGRNDEDTTTHCMGWRVSAK